MKALGAHGEYYQVLVGSYSVHWMIFGLSVGICDDGNIRLVGGRTPMKGYLEVCQDEVWGTIYDSQWSTSNRRVACMQLSFSQFGM